MPTGNASSGQRYELTERLGEGGMAEVFVAKVFGPHGFEKHLAVKRILPELASNESFERRFIGEARVAAGLSHANLVQVVDFGRMGGALYLAMERVDGPDLGRLLVARERAGEPLPLPVVLFIQMELLKGLAYAHERGVVHRDVSPSNVLLSRAGEVKVADFGIALSQDAAATPTRRGEIAGKRGFMSPEQRAGGQVDARSDLYAAGKVLVETLLAGRGLSSVDADASAAALLRRREDVSERLQGIVVRALEEAPEARWQRAEDFLRALLEVTFEERMVASHLELADVVRRHVGTEAPAKPLLGLAALVPKTSRPARHTAAEGQSFVFQRSGVLGETILDRAPAATITSAAEPSSAPRRFTRLAVLATVLMVLAAGAIAVYATIQKRSALPAPTPVVSTAPAPAPVARSPEAQPPSPTPPSAAVTPEPLPTTRAPASAPAPTPAPTRERAATHATPQVRYGTIDLFTDPWALVFLDGKKIAEAPVRGLRLPYGRHRLRLLNPVQQKEMELTVDVPKKRLYRVQLPR